MHVSQLAHNIDIGQYLTLILGNRPILQMQMLLGACRELKWDYNILPELRYVFQNKT